MAECTAARDVADLLKVDTPESTKLFTDKLQSCASILNNDSRFTSYVADIKNANWADTKDLPMASDGLKSAYLAVNVVPSKQSDGAYTVASVDVEHQGNKLQQGLSIRPNVDHAYAALGLEPSRLAPKALLADGTEMVTRLPLGGMAATTDQYGMGFNAAALMMMGKGLGLQTYVLTSEIKK